MRVEDVPGTGNNCDGPYQADALARARAAQCGVRAARRLWHRLQKRHARNVNQRPVTLRQNDGVRACAEGVQRRVRDVHVYAGRHRAQRQLWRPGRCR
jgi:hypothetical protein